VLCGYVGVPTSHPYFGKPYDYPSVISERSIDYACEADGLFSHVPSWKDGPQYPRERIWYFGFDCSQVGDLTPRFADFMVGAIYRDFTYVTEHVTRLAEQLAKVEE
jgi:hypothetical protein